MSIASEWEKNEMAEPNTKAVMKENIRTSAHQVEGTNAAPGLKFPRYFTRTGVSPYDEVEWELRIASITDAKGNSIFEQRNVETPKDWSMTATNIVASKYLHGALNTPGRETGVRQLIQRVAETIRDWGWQQGYFSTAEDRDTFHDELVHILVQQKAAFNSPVWFNVGCDRLEPNSDAQNWHWNAAKGQVEFTTTGYKAPQCSACFINSVRDSLDSILTLAKTEGMLFKWGSGTGTNLSALRGSKEELSGGGQASGPLSFMKGFRRRDQIGRQDPPRRQDGDPQHRPSGHRPVHRLQDGRREESLGADRDGV
jgi:ribonucleoside-diphosphate reductase alpha chain